MNTVLVINELDVLSSYLQYVVPLGYGFLSVPLDNMLIHQLSHSDRT